MPPRMITRASAAVAAPTAAGGREKAAPRAPAMELAWVMLPMPKEAPTAKTANTAPQNGSGAAQSGSHNVHGAAVGLSLPVPAAVFYRQSALGKLGGHAQQGGDLHPDQSPRPSCGQSRGHTHDVAGADGGGKSRHQGGKGRHAALAAPAASRLRTLRRAQPRFRQGRNCSRTDKNAPVPSSSARVPGPHRICSAARSHASSAAMATPPFFGVPAYGGWALIYASQNCGGRPDRDVRQSPHRGRQLSI